MVALEEVQNLLLRYGADEASYSELRAFLNDYYLAGDGLDPDAAELVAQAEDLCVSFNEGEFDEPALRDSIRDLLMSTLPESVVGMTFAVRQTPITAPLKVAAACATGFSVLNIDSH